VNPALRRLLQHSQLYNFLQSWRMLAPEPGTIVLSQRRVYILPTRQGLLFAVSLVLMLIGSMNYNLSLGYVLTFLLGGVGVVSILHTFRNLAHLAIRAGRADAVYVGDLAHFQVEIENRDRFDRFSIKLTERSDPASVTVADAPAGGVTTVSLPVHAASRGWLQLDRVTMETRFPIGLARAWSYVQPDMRALVYPRPDDALLPLPMPRTDTGNALASGTGTDDFFGLRDYQASDSPRHVAWKAAARTGVPLTKLFTGQASTEMWFDYAELPDAMGREARLSRLTRWVILGARSGLRFGLRLPGIEVELGEGEAQRERCLRELALFGLPPAGLAAAPTAGWMKGAAVGAPAVPSVVES
jgi:uncharacterized protein (DUF58 family)